MPYQGPTLMDLVMQGVGRATAKKGPPTIEQLQRGEPLGFSQRLGYPSHSALLQELYFNEQQRPDFTSIGGMGGFATKEGELGMLVPGQRPIPGEVKLNPLTGQYEQVGGIPGTDPTIHWFNRGGKFSKTTKNPDGSSTRIDIQGPKESLGSWENEPGAPAPTSEPPPEMQPQAVAEGGPGLLSRISDIAAAPPSASQALTSGLESAADTAWRTPGLRSLFSGGLLDRGLNSLWQSFIDDTRKRPEDSIPARGGRGYLLGTDTPPRKVGERGGATGSWELPKVTPTQEAPTPTPTPTKETPAKETPAPAPTEGVAYEVATLVKAVESLPETAASEIVTEYLTNNIDRIKALDPEQKAAVAAMLGQTPEELENFAEEVEDIPAPAPQPEKKPQASRGILDILRGLGIGPMLVGTNPVAGIQSALWGGFRDPSLSEAEAEAARRRLQMQKNQEQGRALLYNPQRGY